MNHLAQRLAPPGVVRLPAESSSLRSLIYTLVGRLTVPDWAATYGDFHWEAAAARLRDPQVEYPRYYLCNRHGVHNGYLTGWHALGWSYASAWYGLGPLYHQLARTVAAQLPADARILDIGAGTGDWLMQLHAHLPKAHMLAADLSPMMLAALSRRWEHRGYNAQDIQLLHAAGEHLPLKDASCDMVTAMLLLHELPLGATMALFAEARRVLKPGGVFMTFDAIQKPIAPAWLNEIGVRAVGALFHEPDFTTYAHTNIPEVCHKAGFTFVHTHYIGRLPWKFQIQEAR